MMMGPDESGDLDDKLGSFDEGDPQTTNLYVGNLAPQVILPDDAFWNTFNQYNYYWFCLSTFFLFFVFCFSFSFPSSFPYVFF